MFFSSSNTMLELRLNGLSAGLSFPEELAPAMTRLFRNFNAQQDASPTEIMHISDQEDGTFSVIYQEAALLSGIPAEALPAMLCRELETMLAANSIDAVLQAGAVSDGDDAVLVAGPQGSGKSTLVAWLCRKGFGYLADNFVSLATRHSDKHSSKGAISPLPMPLVLHPHLDGAQQLDARQILQITKRHIIATPASAERGNELVNNCRLVIHPQYHEGARFAITPLSPAELQFLLSQSLHPSQANTSFNGTRISNFASHVPAISVRFGSYLQLEEQLDCFVRDFLKEAPRPNLLRDFCNSWRRGQQNNSTPTTTSAPGSDPKRTWIKGTRPKLTIAMATLDDFDGAYFTLQSLRLHHREVVEDVEFLVLDNNPDGPCAEPLRYLEQKIPNYRYIPIRERTGTAIRDFAMAEATSDYVLNLDCHVLLEPGAVARLIRYFEENPDTDDLLQGPILWDELSQFSTHMDPLWSKGFFGTWARDERGADVDGAPFEIPMQGLGLYACRRAAWPGFNPRFRGFGGEEGYIHEKFRQRGGRVLCLPFLRWLHRFYRPFGVPYKISWDDRIWNYLVGAKELNLDPQSIVEHFREYLGQGHHTLIDIVAQAVEAEVPSLTASFAEGHTPR